MTHFTSPRHRICLDNVIRRPTEQAEKKSRKVGTAKRAGYAMAARFVRRLACQETGSSMRSWPLTLEP